MGSGRHTVPCLGDELHQGQAGTASGLRSFSSPRRLSRAPHCTALPTVFSLASFYQEARFHAGGISLFMVEGCRPGMVTCSHASATGKTRRTRCSVNFRRRPSSKPDAICGCFASALSASLMTGHRSVTVSSCRRADAAGSIDYGR
jgi:hypothetical protein